MNYASLVIMNPWERKYIEDSMFFTIAFCFGNELF